MKDLFLPTTEDTESAEVGFMVSYTIDRGWGKGGVIAFNPNSGYLIFPLFFKVLIEKMIT